MLKIDENQCTACGACLQSCPKKCISLQNDKGYDMPVIDASLCVQCGKCEQVCHLNNQKFDCSIENLQAMACVNNDKKQLQRETSGGVFGAIAKWVLNKKGVVYGCAYTNHLKATQIRVDDVSGLTKLYGSKYVRSCVENTYVNVLEDLKKGLLVLYSGTPCQIAGLKSFLKVEYDNLITVDLICHGVPEQTHFLKFVKWYEKKYNVSLNDVSFRDKSNKGWALSGKIYGIKENKKYQKKLFYFDNWYYFYFMKGMIYRESCYSCRYTNLYREGDFTLGDCWGSEKLNLPFSDKNGCSLVLLNSEKSKKIFKELDVTAFEISLDKAVVNNGQLKEPTKKPDNYLEIMQMLAEKEGEEIQKDFKRRYKKAILVGKIKYSIPQSLKRLLMKIK